VRIRHEHSATATTIGRHRQLVDGGGFQIVASGAMDRQIADFLMHDW
jgi:hypothetical protein